MTIWLALFIIIIAVSFILAYLSMKDFQETPAKMGGFGIFLIQNPHKLGGNVLNSLFNYLSKTKEIITLERLFKGSKSALIVTGPKVHLEKYKFLNLLELEDFTNIDEADVQAWEVGVKEDTPRPISILNIFSNLPEFDTNEQFWWQLTLQPSSSGFICQIRAVLYSKDSTRRKKLAEGLEGLGDNKLRKIPRPIASDQILRNFKLRSITPKDPYLLNIDAQEILQLVGKIS